MSLIGELTKIKTRINGLENSSLDEDATISRIKKMYSNLRLKVKVKVYKNECLVCSEELECSEETYI